MSKKSSNTRARKRAEREAVKAAKKYPVIVLAAIIIIVAIVILAYLFTPFKDVVNELLLGEYSSSTDTDNQNDSGGNTDKPDEPIVSVDGELSVHFLELGNWYTGDCILIDIGDTEVLIDAGSRNASAATIVPYVNTYCADGKLEYVIATHAHQDHIAGFVGTKAAPGVFDSFTIGTIIDFSMTNATSTVYKNYLSERDEAVSRGATHYTAKECWYEENGAKRTYEITEGVSFSILYQKFYEEKSSDENNYSVCALFTAGSEHFLFTGDLEKEGEESLVESNSLPVCKLFKAGHHGSKTSSNDALLSVIQPEIVCVCCCAGSDEYTSTEDNQFPTQAFIDRIKKYTDQVYVTSLSTDNEEKTYESMNGNIVITLVDGKYRVTCSGSSDVLKDSEWCKKNRVW